MNSKNNGLVQFSETIIGHWNCLLSSVVKDDKDEHGLKLEKIGPTFSIFNAMHAKPPKQIVMVSAPWWIFFWYLHNSTRADLNLPQYPLNIARFKAPFRKPSIKMIKVPYSIWKLFHVCSIPVLLVYFIFILNIGTCVDQINGYKCQCQPGYTGIDCDVDTDECQSSPCINGKVQVTRVENQIQTDKDEFLRNSRESMNQINK